MCFLQHNTERPDKDLEYDQEKAQERRDMIVNELLPKLEQERKDVLSADFEPNDDWWGSKVTFHDRGQSCYSDPNYLSCYSDPNYFASG